ncbi:hypothetical protein FRX31_003509, partial [Thalictrum thalictroides]
RVGGQPMHPRETRDFVEAMQTAGLTDLKSIGFFYTWTKRSGLMSRIDRCLVNGHWIEQHFNSEVEFLPFGLSDHCPEEADSSVARWKSANSLRSVKPSPSVSISDIILFNSSCDESDPSASSTLANSLEDIFPSPFESYLLKILSTSSIEFETPFLQLILITSS